LATDRTPGGSTRRLLSLALIIVGALLLLVMPLALFFFALSGNTQNHLPGTLVIVTATGGMVMLVLGFALRN